MSCSYDLQTAYSDETEHHGHVPRQHCHLSMVRWNLTCLTLTLQHDDMANSDTSAWRRGWPYHASIFFSEFCIFWEQKLKMGWPIWPGGTGPNRPIYFMCGPFWFFIVHSPLFFCIMLSQLHFVLGSAHFVRHVQLAQVNIEAAHKIILYPNHHRFKYIHRFKCIHRSNSPKYYITGICQPVPTQASTQNA
jgi:hypothetical protein